VGEEELCHLALKLIDDYQRGHILNLPATQAPVKLNNRVVLARHDRKQKRKGAPLL